MRGRLPLVLTIAVALSLWSVCNERACAQLAAEAQQDNSAESYIATNKSQPEKQEPAGVRIRTLDKLPESVLIPWGATAKTISSMFRPAKGKRPSDPVVCEDGECSIDYHWHLDLGEDYTLGAPVLYLTGRSPGNDPKFYRFGLSFNSDGFELVRDAIIKALGPPSTSIEIPTQNAFGAVFTGSVMTWDNRTTLVELSSRVARIDQAVMVVTYKPLAPPEKKKEAKAPF